MGFRMGKWVWNYLHFGIIFFTAKIISILAVKSSPQKKRTVDDFHGVYPTTRGYSRRLGEEARVGAHFGAGVAVAHKCATGLFTAAEDEGA